jgi:hypothetical protein
MTIELKRYIPYKLSELYKGIHRKDLDADWKILLLKSHNKHDPDTCDLILEHKQTTLKTKRIEISNSHTEDKRGNNLGYIGVRFRSRFSFRCIYGPQSDNIFKALSLTLRNPNFVMELYNLKTRRTPYQYCTKKFGPIFDDLRCSQWQLHS